VGAVSSPLLANIFLHYALDAWMSREFPAIPFERYADDVILHCKTQRRARDVLGAITERIAQLGLEIHPAKTRIVYCRDSNRRGSHEHERFDFLGYTFRPRMAVGRGGAIFTSFCPGVADDAAKAIRRQIKRWRLHLRSAHTLHDLARAINPIVRGWLGYYGRFYRSRLAESLRHIDEYLVRWAMRKHKRVRGKPRRAWDLLHAIRRRQPALFAHWTRPQPNAG
jgi:RNA-directed DNA polymerase